MITIKVLGSGCPTCKKLEASARKVTEDLHLDAQIEKITDYQQIMKMGILSTPGLVINDKVVSSGRLPSEAEISAWLKQAAA